MASHNILSISVTLKEDVKKGQAVTLTGKLASSGSGTDEPAGVAQYDGVIGELVAIMVIGIEEVTVEGAIVGGGVAATAGNFTLSDGEIHFGVVQAVYGKRAQIIIGTAILPSMSTLP